MSINPTPTFFLLFYLFTFNPTLMQMLETTQKKISLVKERVAALSNMESRLTASGDIDTKCPPPGASGDNSTMAVEIFF